MRVEGRRTEENLKRREVRIRCWRREEKGCRIRLKRRKEIGGNRDEGRESKREDEGKRNRGMKQEEKEGGMWKFEERDNREKE